MRRPNFLGKFPEETDKFSQILASFSKSFSSNSQSTDSLKMILSASIAAEEEVIPLSYDLEEIAK